MKQVRISASRLRTLFCHNSQQLEKHITRIGELESLMAEEESKLRECLLQRKTLESLTSIHEN